MLFRRKRELAKDEVLEKDLTERMAAVGAQIPAIGEWLFRANELERPICGEYVLDSSIEDGTALQEYLMHPLHQVLVSDLKPYFEWAAVDYTISPVPR